MRLPTRYELGQEFFRWEFATAVAGSILGDQPVRPARRAGGQGPGRTRCSRGRRRRRSSPSRLDRRAARAGAEPPDYVCIQAFVEPTAENEADDRGARRPRARARRAASSRTASARATCTRPASCTRAAPTRAASCRWSRTTAPSSPIPGEPFGFARLIRAQAAGDFDVARASAAGASRASSCEEVALMQLGMIGLGRMGGNMTSGCRATATRSRPTTRTSTSTAATLEELRDQLDAPRAFWMMVPAGQDHRGDLPAAAAARRAGRHDRRRRQLELPRLAAARTARRAEQGIHFVDAGVSGGIWGLEVGYCLMVGGEAEAVARLEPIFATLAPADGYAHVGGPGRRPLREDGPQRDRVRADAGLRRGVRGARDARSSTSTCTRSPGSGATARSSAPGCSSCSHAAFEHEGGKLERIQGYVEDSGEGRWTIAEAIAEDVPGPGDHGGALRALRLPPGRVVRRQGERGAPQPVRRARRPGGRARMSTAERGAEPAARGAARSAAGPTRARSSSSAPRAT